VLLQNFLSTASQANAKIFLGLVAPWKSVGSGGRSRT
jgi:hypothetical protein